MKRFFKILLVIGAMYLIYLLIFACRIFAREKKNYAESFTEWRSYSSNSIYRYFALSPTEMREIQLNVCEADNDYLKNKINVLKKSAQSQLSKERFVGEEDKEILVWLKENLADSFPAGSEQIAVLNIDDYKSKNASSVFTKGSSSKTYSREGVFKITMAEDGSVANIRDMSGVGFKTTNYNYEPPDINDIAQVIIFIIVIVGILIYALYWIIWGDYNGGGGSGDSEGGTWIVTRIK